MSKSKYIDRFVEKFQAGKVITHEEKAAKLAEINKRIKEKNFKLSQEELVNTHDDLITENLATSHETILESADKVPERKIPIPEIDLTGLNEELNQQLTPEMKDNYALRMLEESPNVIGSRFEDGMEHKVVGNAALKDINVPMDVHKMFIEDNPLNAASQFLQINESSSKEDVLARNLFSELLKSNTYYTSDPDQIKKLAIVAQESASVMSEKWEQGLSGDVVGDVVDRVAKRNGISAYINVDDKDMDQYSRYNKRLEAQIFNKLFSNNKQAVDISKGDNASGREITDFSNLSSEDALMLSGVALDIASFVTGPIGSSVTGGAGPWLQYAADPEHTSLGWTAVDSGASIVGGLIGAGGVAKVAVQGSRAAKKLATYEKVFKKSAPWLMKNIGKALGVSMTITTASMIGNMMAQKIEDEGFTNAFSHLSTREFASMVNAAQAANSVMKMKDKAGHPYKGDKTKGNTVGEIKKDGLVKTEGNKSKSTEITKRTEESGSNSRNEKLEGDDITDAFNATRANKKSFDGYESIKGDNSSFISSKHFKEIGKTLDEVDAAIYKRATKGADAFGGAREWVGGNTKANSNAKYKAMEKIMKIRGGHKPTIVRTDKGSVALDAKAQYHLKEKFLEKGKKVNPTEKEVETFLSTKDSKEYQEVSNSIGKEKLAEIESKSIDNLYESYIDTKVETLKANHKKTQKGQDLSDSDMTKLRKKAIKDNSKKKFKPSEEDLQIAKDELIHTEVSNKSYDYLRKQNINNQISNVELDVFLASNRADIKDYAKNNGWDVNEFSGKTTKVNRDKLIELYKQDKLTEVDVNPKLKEEFESFRNEEVNKAVNANSSLYEARTIKFSGAQGRKSQTARAFTPEEELITIEDREKRVATPSYSNVVSELDDANGYVGLTDKGEVVLSQSKNVDSRKYNGDFILKGKNRVYNISGGRKIIRIGDGSGFKGRALAVDNKGKLGNAEFYLNGEQINNFGFTSSGELFLNKGDMYYILTNTGRLVKVADTDPTAMSSEDISKLPTDFTGTKIEVKKGKFNVETKQEGGKIENMEKSKFIYESGKFVEKKEIGGGIELETGKKFGYDYSPIDYASVDDLDNEWEMKYVNGNLIKVLKGTDMPYDHYVNLKKEANDRMLLAESGNPERKPLIDNYIPEDLGAEIRTKEGVGIYNFFKENKENDENKESKEVNPRYLEDKTYMGLGVAGIIGNTFLGSMKNNKNEELANKYLNFNPTYEPEYYQHKYRSLRDPGANVPFGIYKNMESNLKSNINTKRPLTNDATSNALILGARDNGLIGKLNELEAQKGTAIVQDNNRYDEQQSQEKSLADRAEQAEMQQRNSYMEKDARAKKANSAQRFRLKQDANNNFYGTLAGGFNNLMNLFAKKRVVDDVYVKDQAYQTSGLVKDEALLNAELAKPKESQDEGIINYLKSRIYTARVNTKNTEADE